MKNIFVIPLCIKAQTRISQIGKQNIFMAVEYSHNSSVKRSKLLIHTITYVSLNQTTALSARSQLEKSMYCMIPFIKFKKCQQIYSDSADQRLSGWSFRADGNALYPDYGSFTDVNIKIHHTVHFK